MSRVRANTVTNFAGTGTPSLPYGIQVGAGATVRGDTNTINLLTNGSERLRITSDGDIGVGNDASFPIYTDANDRNFIIGTGSDDTAIQIHSGTSKYGGVYFGDATSGGDRYSGYVEYKHDDNFLRFGSGGIERLRITSAGDMGLGTVSPTSDGGITFEIYDATTPTLKLNDGGDYKALFQLRGNDLEIRGSSGVMEFYTGAADGAASTMAMRVDSSGHTHLGDRSHASNNTYYGPAQVNICGPDNPPTSLTRAGSYLDIGGTESLVNSMQYISFGFGSNYTYKPAFIGYQTISAGGAEYGDLFFATRNVTSDTEPSERLRITYDGKVGIGLINPTTALTIRDDSASAGHAVLRLENLQTESSPTECNLEMWLNNSNSNNPGISIGAIENGNDGYADIVFQTTPQSNSSTLEERVRIRAAGGITFNGETSSAHALDDYEEGTWTATCSNGITLYSNGDLCSYTKIGRQVTVTGQIRVNGSNNNSSLIISNLPFTNMVVTEGEFYSVGGVRLYNADISAAAVQVICVTDNGSNNLYFNEMRDNAADTHVQATNGGYYMFTITYFTTS